SARVGKAKLVKEVKASNPKTKTWFFISTPECLTLNLIRYRYIGRSRKVYAPVQSSQKLKVTHSEVRNYRFYMVA
ncbi:hypothetical protein, partial [Merismopedia glauca]